MKFLKYVLFFFVLGCSIFKDSSEEKITDPVSINNSEEVKHHPLIIMKRTPCFGRCPNYELIIYSNGEVQYEGKKFVEKIGLYKSKIDIKKIALIKDQIQRVNFFSFDTIYDARVSDLPSTIIEVNFQGLNHSVKGRYGMPSDFKFFSNFLDDLVNGIKNWSRIIE